MATNAIVLIAVTTMALLLLAGVVVGVVYKTRTRQRRGKKKTIRDQTGEDALRLRRQETIADRSAAKAHAAQVEVDIKTVQACRLNGKRRTIAAKRPPTATNSTC